MSSDFVVARVVGSTAAAGSEVLRGARPVRWRASPGKKALVVVVAVALLAILAAFAAHPTRQSLADYLDTQVFADACLDTSQPQPADVAGFDAFTQRYLAALPVQQAAVDHS